jgi:transposase
MVAKLMKEHLMTVSVLSQSGASAAEIARTLRVDESTVRYHLRRRASGAADGRQKVFLVESLGLGAVVAAWWQDRQDDLPAGRSPNASALHAWLVAEHNYPGSVQSVRGYVVARWGRPPLRPFRRVEVPPGSQVQLDWSEHREVDLGDGGGQLVTVYVLHAILGHSRRQVDIACRSCDQLAWQSAHVEAFRRLGGVPAVGRIDNLKTGVSHGSGAWGTINPAYEAFARSLGFHVDPCPVRTPRAKGKVERGVRTFRAGDFRRMAPLGLVALQGWLDQQAQARDQRRRCPVTGLSVWESWERERALLRPLPEPLPQPFDVLVQRRVSRDCLVAFEGRQYSIPFRFAGSMIELRGTATAVELRAPQSGALIKIWPRHTAARLLIDPADYDGESTPAVQRPTPLGAIGRCLNEAPDADGPLRRSIDWYARIADALAAREACA